VLRYWLILACLILIFVIFMEFFEHRPFNGNEDSYFVLEILVVFVVLLIASLLIYIGLSLVTNWEAKEIERLNSKNRFSTVIGLALNQADLAEALFQITSKPANIAYESLLLFNPKTNHFEPDFQWKSTEDAEWDPVLSQTSEVCRVCAMLQPNAIRSLEDWDGTCGMAGPNQQNGYCLPIAYGSSPKALLRFRTLPGTNLQKDELESLTGIAPIIGITLERLRLQKTQLDFNLSEALDNERRAIARDLHDTIGQDLCYLNLKLEQITKELRTSRKETIYKELKVLQQMAASDNASVHVTLVGLYADNASRLGTLIKDHADLISDRSGLIFEVSHHGQAKPLEPDAIRHIFYVCKEAIHNVEKHARAARVSVSIEWGGDNLVIKIADDGRGFDPARVDPGVHFGLRIMRERVEGLGGRMMLIPSPEGTQVEFYIPYAQTGGSSYG